MSLKGFKYMAAYIVPVLFAWSLYVGHWSSFSVVLFAFVLVPILEMILGEDSANLETEETSRLSQMWIYDLLLYLNLPIVYLSIAGYVGFFGFDGATTLEWIGLTASLGILLGANGINVAHELGHRTNPIERFMSVLLLMPSFYMHFIIEHNRGHHRNVGTPMDPATARRDETLYQFWIRSAIGGWVHAWQLEAQRLEGESMWVMIRSNLMVRYTLIQLLYVVAMYVTFGWQIALGLIASGVIGFLLLESINYVEHYGLMRKKLESGRFERVRSWHSWNSDHKLGRIILYELTRHSDHHYLANKKYQILDRHEVSPQLPYGYPSSILIALIPAIWFRVMNPRIDNLALH